MSTIPTILSVPVFLGKWHVLLLPIVLLRYAPLYYCLILIPTILQLVWCASTHVGFGGAFRDDGSAIVVARYKESGNMPYQFEENVKPLEDSGENSDDDYDEEYGECDEFFSEGGQTS